MMHANDGQTTPKTQQLVFVLAVWNMQGGKS